VNGYEVGKTAAALTRIATMPPEQLADFGAASHRILEARCPTRAFGEGLAKLLAAARRLAASPRP